MLMLLLFSVAGKLHADETSQSFFPEAFFTKPQSPDAWAMTRYGEASLDLFHGTAGLTVPVYTYQDRDFTIPVALSYASSGFMPGASVGPAGSGWHIVAGGSITRAVRGLPDDMSNEYSWKWYGDPDHAKWVVNIPGVPYYEEQLYGARSNVEVWGYAKAYATRSENISGDIDYVYTGGFGDEYMAVHIDKQSTAGRYLAIETQPDIFHFNFMGRSGSFILCPDGTVRVFDTDFPAGDLSVEFVWDWRTPAASSFILRTSDGFRYDFDLREDSSSFNQGYQDSENSCVSSWKLTKATAPSGRTVTFSYTAPHDRMSHWVSVNVDHRHSFDGSIHSRPWQDSEYMIAHPEVSDTYTTVQERCLSSITVSGRCSIEFSYGNASSEHSLESIVVRNASGRTVRSCTLEQSGSGTHRFLKSITIPGEGTHSFSYIGESSSFPDKYTRAVDMYGYYSGSTAWQSLTHTDANLEAYTKSLLSSRKFNAEYAKTGMLERVTWPTGGSTLIAYEQNRYGALVRPDAVQSSDSEAAGLRVASLTSLAADGATVLQKRTYRYETASGRSSGILLSSPELYWKYSYELPWGLSVEREGVRSASPIGFGLSSHIEYPRVREIISDGKTGGGSEVVREFESTYGSVGNITSRERYVQASDPQVRTGLDGWYFDFRPHTVYTPESAFLSGGIHSGKCKLLQTFTAEGLGTSREEMSYGEYPSGTDRTFRVPFVYMGRLFDHEYHYRSGMLSSTTEYMYDLGGSVVMQNTVTRSVDDSGHLTSIRTTDSKGNELRTDITYHVSCPGVPEKVVRKRGAYIIGSSKMNYLVRYNQEGRPYLLPSASLRARSSDNLSSESGLSYRTVATFDSYDALGNLLQMTDSTGMVTGIVWNESGMYPEKVGENMTWSQTVAAGSSTAGRLLTMYDWEPLVGLRSLTDPAGRVWSWTYDSAGRLVGALAPDGSILSVWTYNTASDHMGLSQSGLYSGVQLQLPAERNWILSQSFSSNGGRKSEVSYYDALGFPEQDIAVRASGDGLSDLVMPHVQDYLFRETREYLAYPVSVSASRGAGSYVPGAVDGQNAYYRSRLSLVGDAGAYTESAYESTISGRRLWARRAGRAHASAGKRAVYGYGANSAADAVLRIDVGPASGYIRVGGTYPAGSLVRTSVTDEDGRTSVVFSDKEGHTVLERRLSATGAVTAQTYYAYDDFGRLCWTVQPEGAELLSQGQTYYRYPSGSDSASRTLNKYCYIYHYCADDHIIEKNLAWVKNGEYIYGDNYLIEAVSEGNVLSDGGQIVYRYDGLNRVYEEFVAGGSMNGVLRSRIFDTYPSGMDIALSFSDVGGVTTAGIITLRGGGTAGLLTYEEVAELDESGPTGRYALKAYYYDKLGNCIQDVTRYPDGVVLRESRRYDLDGKVLAACSSVEAGSGLSSVVVTSSSYDARGRLVGTTTTIDGYGVSSTSLSYDALGLLQGTVYGNGVSESFSYNVRGEQVSRTVSRGGTVLFSSLLRYEDGFAGAGNVSWSGNISSWSWMQAGAEERTYLFDYDALDRLVSTAQYLGSRPENRYGEDVSWDRNGNVTRMERRGGAWRSGVEQYSYDGNLRSGWLYDSSGNVTCQDSDAEYPTYVSYNLLNLPARVHKDENFTTKLLYLADGHKLSVEEAYSGDGFRYYGPFRVRMLPGGGVRLHDATVPGGRAQYGEAADTGCTTCPQTIWARLGLSPTTPATSWNITTICLSGSRALRTVLLLEISAKLIIFTAARNCLSSLAYSGTTAWRGISAPPGHSFLRIP